MALCTLRQTGCGLEVVSLCYNKSTCLENKTTKTKTNSKIRKFCKSHSRAYPRERKQLQSHACACTHAHVMQPSSLQPMHGGKKMWSTAIAGYEEWGLVIAAAWTGMVLKSGSGDAMVRLSCGKAQEAESGTGKARGYDFWLSNAQQDSFQEQKLSIWKQKVEDFHVPNTKTGMPITLFYHHTIHTCTEVRSHLINMYN